METLTFEDAKDLLKSPQNVICSIVDVVLDSINLLATAYVFIEMRTTKLMHQNLRLMMLSLTGALCLFSLTMLWKNAWFLMLTSYEFCQSISGFYNLQCYVDRILHDILQHVFGVTLLGIAIERLVATVFLKNYGEYESTAIPIIIISLEWLLAIVIALTYAVIDITNFGFDTKHLFLTCSIFFTHPTGNMHLFFFGFVGFAVLCGALVFLYRYNKMEYRKVGKRSLSARYQIAENIANLHFLVPCFISYGFFYITSIVFLSKMTESIAQEGLKKEVIKNGWIYQQLQNLMCTFYTTVYCAICFTLHFPMRQSLKGQCLCFQKAESEKEGNVVRVLGIRGQQLNFEAEGDLYFSKLNEMTHPSSSAKRV